MVKKQLNYFAGVADTKPMCLKFLPQKESIFINTFVDVIKKKILKEGQAPYSSKRDSPKRDDKLTNILNQRQEFSNIEGGACMLNQGESDMRQTMA